MLAVALLCAAAIHAQNKTPLDRYLDDAEIIVVAKCLSVGSVNILLRANVRIQILLVIKGKEALRELTIESQYGMEPGKTYLLRTENKVSVSRPYFTVESRDAAIPVSRHEDIETLKKLSPRIVVLRTMNLRIDTLESEIRRLNYELEALIAARKEN